MKSGTGERLKGLFRKKAIRNAPFCLSHVILREPATEGTPSHPTCHSEGGARRISWRFNGILRLKPQDDDEILKQVQNDSERQNGAEVKDVEQLKGRRLKGLLQKFPLPLWDASSNRRRMSRVRLYAVWLRARVREVKWFVS